MDPRFDHWKARVSEDAAPYGGEPSEGGSFEYENDDEEEGLQ